jgi:hypothetical protein
MMISNRIYSLSQKKAKGKGETGDGKIQVPNSKFQTLRQTLNPAAK